MPTWPAPLETDRLVLRPWRETDAEALFRYASDPELGPACGFDPHASIDDSRAVLRDCLMLPEQYAITIKPSDEAVGAIGLNSDDRNLPLSPTEREVGFWLGRPFWGHGYMPEATRKVLRHGFLDLGLTTIWCGYYEGNEKSARTQEKVGFHPHHVTESSVDRRGVEHREHLSRITRAEWVCALAADPGDENTISHQQAEAVRIIDALPLVAYVRTGGQTGADRGGLDAARACGVPICGWCPPGGLSEDYPEPPGLLAVYPELVEGHSSGYVERTAWNVRDSHATLIVAPDGIQPRSGTEMTRVFAEQFGRPVLVVSGPEDAPRILDWLSGIGRGLTLNVAGPRESKSPGVYEVTRDIIRAVLEGAR